MGSGRQFRVDKYTCANDSLVFRFFGDSRANDAFVANCAVFDFLVSVNVLFSYFPGLQREILLRSGAPRCRNGSPEKTHLATLQCLGIGMYDPIHLVE